MRNNRIVILHVFLDGIIFSGIADLYDSIENIDNLYYYYSPDIKFKFQFINDNRVQTIRCFKEYVGYFSDPCIDVILFHALPYQHYYLFNYIDKRKFVIWWAWGYDLYYGQGKNPPLISMKEMYKPITKAYMESKKVHRSTINMFVSKAALIPGYIARRFKCFLHPGLTPKFSQADIISRIDAFYSPLDIEYDLIKTDHPYFCAQKCPKFNLKKDIPFIFKEKPGNILINHSLTYTDNHLDVFSYIKNFILDTSQKYIIPISYGIDGFDGNADILIALANLDESQVQWLTSVLPADEYNSIIDSASHAIYGPLRQQALGNIYKCLIRGIKVYLFEDSILYQELIKKGYKIFSIEKDLTEVSLSLCLSKSDAMINHDIFVEERNKNTPQAFKSFLENAIAEKQNLHGRIS